MIKYDSYNGKDIHLYTISDGELSVGVLDLGGTINFIKAGGVDITLGFNSVTEYIKSGSYAGATIGRVANRIAGGKFLLNGKQYSLNTNDGANHLHGGKEGFDRKLFKVLNRTDNWIEMQYISVDGEENYPGTLKLNVKFTVCNNCLTIDYTAESDADTLWNPTNHTYFNLDGEGAGGCLGNLVEINSDSYTPADATLIPTGEKRSVKGTPFDFNTLKEIGMDFKSGELNPTNGYDHNFILNGEHAVHCESRVTGIKMDLYTDMPCLQLYTGGALKPSKGKSINYGKWAGFCLEPQYCPDAINKQGFDKPVLKAGEVKKHYIKYKFN